MVNHNNHNQNNNTTAIKKKTVSPIILNKITTNSPPIEEWSIHSGNKYKRIHSDSSNPTSPQALSNKVHKKLFSSSNRFEVLSQTSNLDNNPKAGPDANLGTNFNHEDDQIDSLAIKPFPPVFVRGVDDFPEVCKCLVENIGVDNFVCKSSTDRLKIQTSTPEAYRSTYPLSEREKCRIPYLSVTTRQANPCSNAKSTSNNSNQPLKIRARIPSV